MKLRFSQCKKFIWISFLVTGLLFISASCKIRDKEEQIASQTKQKKDLGYSEPHEVNDAELIKDIFSLKNGILHRNGKQVFALGLSYYASYHPQKFPVLPEKDRIGEMQKDIKGMHEAGFNMIRIAALGDIKRSEDGTVKVEFPLVDATVDYAGNNSIASVVRLQGYITNLSGYTDAKMWNEQDKEIGPYNSFILTCLNHEGIRKDEEEACVASAAHFRSHPSVIGFQIYNEPAYFPRTCFYDYNPHSIRAWRQWMVERGFKSASEAEKLQPPRRRPYYDEDASDWINWRLFHHERMSWYLNNLSDKAKEGNPAAGTMTCLTMAPFWPGPALSGEDYFRIAERMDIMGITHYIPFLGPRHYQACALLDMAESAAAIFGKHAWLMEANAATILSAENWERQTFSIIGSGFKGILYYQWRADYPFPDSPEPERFGMLYNDGRRTAKFERAVTMNRLINETGTLFTHAEKKRSGIAVLYSEYANAWHDARDNRKSIEPGADRILTQTLFSYREFRRAGVAVDFVRAGDLARNPLKTKLLIIPSKEGLSAEEKTQIDNFKKTGGQVCNLSMFAGGNGGFDIEGFTLQVDHASWHSYCLDAESVLEKVGIAPLYQVDSRHLDVKVLEGNDDRGQYLVLCLNNIDPLEKPIPARRILRLKLADNSVNAVFLYPDHKEKLKCVKRDDSVEIILPEITTGGFVVVR